MSASKTEQEDSQISLQTRYLAEAVQLLREIRDLIKSVVVDAQQYEQDPPILVNDSLGTCPHCASANVDIGKTDKGFVIYKCLKCETYWVNDEAALKS